MHDSKLSPKYKHVCMPISANLISHKRPLLKMMAVQSAESKHNNGMLGGRKKILDLGRIYNVFEFNTAFSLMQNEPYKCINCIRHGHIVQKASISVWNVIHLIFILLYLNFIRSRNLGFICCVPYSSTKFEIYYSLGLIYQHTASQK